MTKNSARECNGYEPGTEIAPVIDSAASESIVNLTPSRIHSNNPRNNDKRDLLPVRARIEIVHFRSVKHV